MGEDCGCLVQSADGAINFRDKLKVNHVSMEDVYNQSGVGRKVIEKANWKTREKVLMKRIVAFYLRWMVRRHDREEESLDQ